MRLALATVCLLTNLAVHAAATDSTIQTRLTTLAGLGYGDGISLTQASGYTTVYFPAPVDAAVAEPRIVLRLDGGMLAEQGAYLQLLVNGQTRAVVPLRNEQLQAGLEYTLPLTSRDLREPFVALGLRHRFDPRREFCVEQDSGAFVTVGSASGFSYALPGGQPASLRGWFSTLPPEVRIGVSSDTAATLKAAWFIADQLGRRGRSARFVALPAGSDSVDILVNAADEMPGNQSPLQLVERGGRKVLLVRAGGDLALAGEPWRQLLVAPAAVPAKLDVPGAADSAGDVSLEQLGLDAQPQEAAPSIEWHVSMAARRLPLGRAPLRAHLDVIAAPALENEPALLFSYLDGRLMQSDRLKADGRRQRVVIELGGRLGDDLRLLVRYYPKRQECEVARAGLPVQILPESYLQLAPAQGQPERFDELAAWWRPGMRVRYDESLPLPARLATLTALSKQLSLEPQLLELAPLASGNTDAHDFAWITRSAPPERSGSVHLDRGRLLVRDARGQRVLDSAEIPNVGVWQIVRAGKQRGLWIYPSTADAELQSAPNLRLGASDVAFVANGAVLLELDTAEPELANVTYPEYQNWRTMVRQYRYWLFAFAWILLTVGIVALYRRIRGPRKRT